MSRGLVFPHESLHNVDMGERMRSPRNRGEASDSVRLSYVHGASDVPLLGETICQNLRRTVARLGDREALVVVHQGYRATYRELVEQCEAVAPRPAGPRRPEGRSRRHLVAQPLRVGRRPVRDRAHRRDPRQHQPGLQDRRARVRAEPVGHQLPPPGRAASARPTTRRCSPRCGAGARSCARRSCSTTTGTRCSRDGAETPAERAARARSLAPVRRPDQHPVHVGHHRLPEGRHARRTTTSSTTASSSARRCGTRSATASASRCPSTTASAWCSATSPAPRTARPWSIPGEAFEPLAVLETVQAERCTSLYGVPTMFIGELEHPRFAEFDFSLAAHRHHGRLAVPGRGHEEGADDDAHARGDHRLRHDRDLAGLDAERHRRPAREARGDRRPRAPARRDQDRRPRDRRRSSRAGRPGELCTRGYSVMLGYWNNEEATRQAIDAARWMHTGDLATMDDDGYVNIVGRIKDMIIRGGENIYPREVEEFLLRPPGRRRRAGDRRAQREVRRGGHGLGQAARGRRSDRTRSSRRGARQDRDATRSRATGSSSTASR